MDIDRSILAGIFPAIAALLGVTLSELFGRWKRREQFKGILFNKKIDIHAALVGKTSDIAHKAFLTEDDKAVANGLSDDAEKLLFFISSNIFFLTDEVLGISNDFIQAGVKKEISLDERKTKLGAIHRLLRDQCHRELGMKTLEKDLKGMS